MKYSKYHALGNDYIVILSTEIKGEPSPDVIQLICHRNYGIGSDGILLGPLDSAECDFGLRIFNPDGTEAEKSGNGLRIFARFLWDEGLVLAQPFTVETPGGPVSCEVGVDGKDVKAEMGEVRFDSTAAAATALKLGLCEPDIMVHMPGGRLRIQFRKGFFATMTGPVTKICDGVMTDDMFKDGLNE